MPSSHLRGEGGETRPDQNKGSMHKICAGANVVRGGMVPGLGERQRKKAESAVKQRFPLSRE